MPASDSILQLVNGGELGAGVRTSPSHQLECESSIGANVELPMTSVRSVVFNMAAKASELECDTLVWRDGEELGGNFVSGDNFATIHWKPEIGEETDLETARLAGIRFYRESQEDPAEHGGVILRNGDCLRGSVVGVDETNIRFRQATISEMQIPIKRAWKIIPAEHAPLLYGGVRSESTLSDDPSMITLRHSLAGASRQHFDGDFFERAHSDECFERGYLSVPMTAHPARFEVNFVVTSRVSGEPNFQVDFGAEKDTNMDISCYGAELGMSIMPKDVNNWKSVTLRTDQALPAAARSTRLSVRLFVDTIAENICVYLDGVRIGAFRTEGELPLKALREVRIDTWERNEIISDVLVCPWSGEFPGAGGDRPAISLTNGDVVLGACKWLRDGKAFVDSPAGPLTLAANDILSIDFGGVPVPERSEARIHLLDGSVINVDSWRFDGRRLKAHSEWLGDLDIPRDSIAELIFHPSLMRFPKSIESGKEILPDK